MDRARKFFARERKNKAGRLFELITQPTSCLPCGFLRICTGLSDFLSAVRPMGFACVGCHAPALRLGVLLFDELVQVFVLLMVCIELCLPQDLLSVVCLVNFIDLRLLVDVCELFSLDKVVSTMLH